MSVTIEKMIAVTAMAANNPIQFMGKPALGKKMLKAAFYRILLGNISPKPDRGEGD
jgi:hypothetical protein